jgi:hypothetical protein
MERPVLLILLWSFGAWLVYLPLRSLKRGSIQYRGCVYKRTINPMWFWFYTMVAGVCGAVIIIAGSYALLAK